MIDGGVYRGGPTPEGKPPIPALFRKPEPRYVWVAEYGDRRINGVYDSLEKALAAGEYKITKCEIQ